MLLRFLLLLFLVAPSRAQGIRVTSPGSPEGAAILSTGESPGDVLTADGSGGASWAAASGGDSGHIVSLRLTDADTLADHPLSGSPALLQADTVNAGQVSRAYDDTTDEGLIWEEYPASGSTEIVITTYGHATSAPAGAKVVRLGLYCRDIDGSDTWSALADLTDVAIPTSTAVVKTTHTAVTLSTLSCTAGGPVQLGLIRDPDDVSDNLVGDFELQGFFVLFQ